MRKLRQLYILLSWICSCFWMALTILARAPWWAVLAVGVGAFVMAWFVLSLAFVAGRAGERRVR